MTPNIQGDDKRPLLNVADCLERIFGGNQVAARELMEQLHPFVLRIVRRHLPRRDEEEDLTQEVFMKIFSRLDQYRGTAPFKHWVAKIALWTCFDHLRARRARPELRLADLPPVEAEIVVTTLADHSRLSVNDALANRELLRILIAGLNPEDRRVIRWFHLEQKTVAEICQLTGWTNELVKMRIFRARRKLHVALTRLPHWDAPEGLSVPAWLTKRSRQRRRDTALTNIALRAQAA